MRAPSGGDGRRSWPRLTASRGLWERCFTAQSIRVRECLHLRVKDLVFGRDEVLVREGKGGKDCATRLPSAVVSHLSAHLERVCTLHFCWVCRNDWDVESYVRNHRTYLSTRMTSQSDTPLKKKGKIPWYVYFVGAVIYTALAGWLFAESSPLAWVCLISAPVGFYFAWGAWKQEKQDRDDA